MEWSDWPRRTVFFCAGESGKWCLGTAPENSVTFLQYVNNPIFFIKKIFIYQTLCLL